MRFYFKKEKEPLPADKNSFEFQTELGITVLYG